MEGIFAIPSRQVFTWTLEGNSEQVRRLHHHLILRHLDVEDDLHQWRRSIAEMRNLDGYATFFAEVTESSFSSSPASSADRADLGVRQLYAYAMRHYLQMPRDLKGKELLARHTTNVDQTVLHEFADLAERLGFESAEITTLKEIPQMRETSKPLLITNGAGVKKKRRCGLPSVEEYTKDSESFFINHLHSVNDEKGEGLTSFDLLVE